MPRPHRDSALLSSTASPPPVSAQDEQTAILRSNWKWAAFTQFFITFSPVINSDITIQDVENDLVHGTSKALPHIMQRLLYTLTYDRKVSSDTWQSALRKQYSKRDPAANPIGPESTLSGDPPSSPSPEIPGDENLDGDDDAAPGHSEPPTNDDMTAEHQEHDAAAVSPQASRGNSEARNTVKVEDPVPNDSTEPLVVPESKDWNDLPMLAKLDSLHLLTEWQFQNVTRIRQMMKCEDDIAMQWRVEPVGYDSKRNAYWHIGNRLWIQRVPPRPARPLKRKRPNIPSNSSAKTKTSASKRPRTVEHEPTRHTSHEDHNSVGRTQRAAKARANLKLDAQAKELQELTRQAKVEGSSKSSQRLRNKVGTVQQQKALGTRMSARLRGLQEDDEWQPVPEEWLEPIKQKKAGSNAKRGPAKTGLESDEDGISDLTELSEDDESGGDEEPELSEKGDLSIEQEQQYAVAHSSQQDRSDSKGEAVQDEEGSKSTDFIEWETVCATLEEWEHFPQQFQHATHYAEKALYKYLTTYALPAIIEELREQERKRQQEEAITHRKRSSRLAIKEIQREEARVAAKQRADEQEKMSRTRRLEARQQEKEAKESARELRRREREAREAARQAGPSQAGPSSRSSSTPAREQAPNKRGNFPGGKSVSSGTRTPAGDDWVLDCEVCHRHGVNLDDGVPMMSCGICSKWQHITCHDKEDSRAGRPRRNWDDEDFICQKCRLTKTGIASERVSRKSEDSRASKSWSQPALSTGTTQSRILEHRQSGYAQPGRAVDRFYYQYPVSQLPAIQPDATTMSYPYPRHSQPNTISFSHYQPHHHAFTPSPTHATPVYLYSTNTPHPSGSAQQSHQYPHQGNQYNIWDHSTQSSYNAPYHTSAARSSAANPVAETRHYVATTNQPPWQPQQPVHSQASQECYPHVQFSYHRTV